MEQKIRCQSCGMPLGEGFFGTNIDNSPSEEYCKFCYQNGDFFEPRLTLEEMIERSVEHMVKMLHMSEEDAEQLAHSLLPTLKRWRAA